MNVADHESLQRMIGYQIRKFNACRKCLKCESLCRAGAISIVGDSYYINPDKCVRCKMCVTAKYLDGGCMMDKYDYLRLKQTSGVDIGKKIRDSVAALAGKVSTKATLNSLNFDNYIYPSRYNDEREMTRYFSFEFIDEDEARPDVDWTMKSETIDADGVVYGVIPKSDESISRLREELIQSSSGHQHSFEYPDYLY